tara:strand:- start:2748 stop:3092 length:345 start_codon:yes stop_codon:yes gene_type:complete
LRIKDKNMEKYPEKVQHVDWVDFRNLAIGVLGGAEEFKDDFVKIAVSSRTGEEVLTVTRLSLPEHPDGSFLVSSNPVYMEALKEDHGVMGDAFRTHGEGCYIYGHLKNLAIQGL